MKIDVRVFPTILECLDLCAAAVYIPSGNYRQVIYWVAACVLTLSVTW